MKYCVRQKQYSERCIGFILDHIPTKSKQAILPLLSNLKHRHKDIYIYYGSRDWMITGINMSLFKQKDFYMNYQEIPDCSHQVVFSNPGKMAELILNSSQ